MTDEDPRMQLASIASSPASAAASAPPVATIERGEQLLGGAQRAAGQASNDPEHASYASLMQGARAAKGAATVLLAATPRSQFQDLTRAASHATVGAQLLGEAAYVVDSEFSGPTIAATVRDLARQAFDEFEAAFEITQND